MPQHFHRETDRLKNKILTLGGLVEKALHQSVTALKMHNLELAGKIIENDREIDLLEIEIEEDCLKILALHQPVAKDLRFIIAVLKMNGELERIADQAVNIASRVIQLSQNNAIKIPPDLIKMVELTQSMLKDVIDSLVSKNDRLAFDVIERDSEVDKLHIGMYDFARMHIKTDTDNIDNYISLLSVSRNLERVGDQVTNIAEDIIYLITGDIIRHYSNKAKLPVKS